MSFFDDIESRMDEKSAAQEEAMNAEQWDPAPGDLLQGVLLRADYPPTQHGRAVVLIIRNVGKEASGGIEVGKSTKVWCGTVLHRLVTDFEMDEDGQPMGCPKIGTAIAIRYDGEREAKDSNRTYKAYTFMREEADREYWKNLLKIGTILPVPNQAEEPEGGFF